MGPYGPPGLRAAGHILRTEATHCAGAVGTVRRCICAGEGKFGSNRLFEGLESRTNRGTESSSCEGPSRQGNGLFRSLEDQKGKV